MNLKLSLFRVFIAVVETGNIKDAATKIYRSPSAVSMALKQLETEIGEKLFENNYKTSLTAIGNYLYIIAKEQLNSHNIAVSSIQAYNKGDIGILQLASVPSVTHTLLAEVIKEFIKNRPRVKLNIRDIDTLAISSCINRGSIDFGISGRPASNNNIIFEPLFYDRLVIVASVNHPINNINHPIDWKDIQDFTFIANGISETSNIIEVINMHNKANLIMRNTTSLLSLIRANIGITILPELSISKNDTEITTIHLGFDNLLREVGIIKRKNSSSSPMAKIFIDIFNDNIQRYIENNYLLPLK